MMTGRLMKGPDLKHAQCFCWHVWVAGLAFQSQGTEAEPTNGISLVF